MLSRVIMKDRCPNSKLLDWKRELGYREEGAILLRCMTMTVRNSGRQGISDRALDWIPYLYMGKGIKGCLVAVCG